MTNKFDLHPFCLLLTAIAIFSFAAPALAQEDKTLSPYFYVKGDPNVDHLPLKDTRVEIAVSGVIADVKVVQTYRNEGVSGCPVVPGSYAPGQKVKYCKRRA